jgi:hypothetical protein
MSRRILLFILIVGLFSSFSYADYSQNPPVTRIRLSQQLVTSLLRYTRSDIIPEIDLKLLPVENQIELTGRVKGKVYEYLLFAGERYREETPLGTRFSLKFEIKALDDGFLKFVFHKFELGEGINMLPLFNRNYDPQAGELYGQPHLVVETLLWLFKLAPMQDYLVRVKNLEAKTVDIRDLFRFDEEGSMSFKVKSDVISRFLPSPHLEELRIWGLESVVDVDANKVALELALGKGTREHFLPYLKTRRVAYPYWWKEKLRKAAAGEKDLRQNDIHVLQTISIPTLNEIMEAVLPMLNTDKSQKAYDNKEDKAFLFKKVAFELVQASDNPKKSQLKAKIVLKTWDEDGWWGIFPRTKSIWTEVESVYDVKVKLRAKDNNHVEGELYGVELSGKDITWLLTLKMTMTR